MQQQSRRWQRDGKTIAFVPTMGFLHDGHLSLMQQGRRMADHLVVSIFVNPTQFGPGEDLDAYPRNIERDLARCEQTGVDLVFMPTTEDLYGPEYETYVTLEALPAHLCGISRPVHFRGVATVVTKLFNIIKPNMAIFGLKDYQQFVVIKKLVRDLNFDIEIIGAPTVRESDGLAMSSRNAYLTPEQRPSALGLSKALNQAETMVASGVLDADTLVLKARELIEALPGTITDYITICDAETLADVRRLDAPVVMALAVKVGRTRLIDNRVLIPAV